MCISPAFAASLTAPLAPINGGSASLAISVPITVNGQMVDLSIATPPASFFVNDVLSVSGTIEMNGLSVPISGLELGMNAATQSVDVLQLLGQPFVANVSASPQSSVLEVGSPDDLNVSMTNALGQTMDLPNLASISYTIIAPQGVSEQDYHISNDSFTSQVAGTYTITPIVSEFGTRIQGNPVQITVNDADSVVFEMSTTISLSQLYISYSSSSQGVNLISGTDFTQNGSTVTLTSVGIQLLNAVLTADKTYSLFAEGDSSQGLVLMANPSQGVSYTAPSSTSSSSINSGTTASVSLTLSGSVSSLVANGTAMDTITAAVVDQNGNVVSNENGTITLQGTSNGIDANHQSAPYVTLPSGAMVEGGVTNGTDTEYFTLNQGIAMITVIAPDSVPASNDQLTVYLVNSNQQDLASQSLSISYTAASAAQSAASDLDPSSYLNTFNQNQAQNDSGFWARSSGNFYISAQTVDPMSTEENTNSTGPSLLNVMPNQTLYLFAYEHGVNVNANQFQWFVNSPDATVNTADNGYTWGSGGSPSYQIVEGNFIASKPGIYTVQAESNGVYSIPLVITVGMSDLQSTPFANTGSTTGIEPLPSDLPNDVAQETNNQVTYTPYQPIGGWVPISGSTSLSISKITVILQGADSSQSWGYELPVVNGQFSGMVRSPYNGSVMVTLFPKFFTTLTTTTDENQDYSYPSSSYTVTINAPIPDQTKLNLYASAQMNYNMSPIFAQTADQLLENSTSLPSAIEAISNLTSESIVYNHSADQFNAQGLDPTYVWQDGLTALTTHSGVCEDYSNVAAAFLRSIGIQAQTVDGYANGNWTSLLQSDSNPADAHQWDEAMIGNQGLIFDPTWDVVNNGSPVWSIFNEFFTNTPMLQETHLPTPGETNEFVSKPSVSIS
ncbi:transglutaminase domain-containing protein [Sulfoacidibacillus ferrooxidans]|nr:transglutaminase domain-containing protein [Sulfoacidibacillus ferrooxidans]